MLVFEMVLFLIVALVIDNCVMDPEELPSFVHMLLRYDPIGVLTWFVLIEAPNSVIRTASKLCVCDDYVGPHRYGVCKERTPTSTGLPNVLGSPGCSVLEISAELRRKK